MTTHHARKFPVILLTGTPGSGKSTHAQLLAATSSIPLKHLNVGELVKEHGLHEGWDEEWKSWTVDEDRLLDHLEAIINPEDGPAETGFIIDHHAPSLFPERWVDLAVVFQCDNGVLYERLTARNYPENKLQENVTSEIMQVVLNETRESYAEEIIVVLSSSGKEDGEMDENVRRVDEWASQWVKDHVEEEDQA